VVNALSETVHLTVYRNGEIHQQSYTLGVPDAPMRVTGKTDQTG
jgi:DNA gyrase subunit B